MPTAARLDHIGLTVPDIEVATQLFEQLLGARQLYDVGPFSATDNWMVDNVGVHPRAIIRTMRMLALPGGGFLELFAYEGPGAEANVPINSQVGGYHAAFRVVDMEPVIARAQALGLRIMGEMKHIMDGPSAGLQWLYVQTPWGLQLELVSYPEGWPTVQGRQ
jgi:catechol 2,3-dioxygenase-like lactoylglutathione lyase family enzyme